jgi:type I restriction enzyme S subunit
MPQLESFHLCAPDVDVQRRIVVRLKQQLAEADALRAALEQQLRDLDALPQRILALAFEN